MILSFLKERQKEKLYKKISYSQCGEDLIVSFIFNALNILFPKYLDIGANHPVYLNNTYYFYLNGSTGVCVEPDPVLFSKLKYKRAKDICLNAGVGSFSQKQADFYIMSTDTLNTFSKEEAERYQSYGTYKIKEVIKMPILEINDIVDQYLFNLVNFISIDIEGLELEILKTLDFSRIRPEVFCIETLTYTEDKTEQKNQQILDYMINNGYFVYADTYINTIFVDRKKWNNQ